MQYPLDDDLRIVLREFNVAPSALLGHGGEAWVYALDESKVIRVCHAGTHLESVLQRQTLVDELSAGNPPFALPETIEISERHGRVVCIERRLAGVSLMHALSDAEGREREQLVEAYLETASRLGDLPLTHRGWFGQLIGPNPIRATTWSGFLRDRAAASLRAAGFAELADPDELARALPNCDEAHFVHLDAFPGNMLVMDGAVSAVIDFSATSLAGDRRLEPLSAAVYLAAPTISPTARPIDVEVANSWLETAGLTEHLEASRRWLAAFWSFAVDDHTLHQWCRSVLTER